ncbi:unnamed protein product [Prunus armeniaca]
MAHKGLIGLLLSPFTSPRIICLQSDPLASALRLQPSAFGPHPSTLNLRPSTSGILPILFDWDTVVVEEKLQLQRRLTCWNFWPTNHLPSVRSFAFGPPPLAISLRPSPSAFGPHPSTLNLRPSTSGILPILFDWDTFVVEEKLQLQRRLTCWNFKPTDHLPSVRSSAFGPPPLAISLRPSSFDTQPSAISLQHSSYFVSLGYRCSGGEITSSVDIELLEFLSASNDIELGVLDDGELANLLTDSNDEQNE